MDRVDRMELPGGRRARTRLQIHATDEDGNKITVGAGAMVRGGVPDKSISPSQTFIVAPEPGAAPAKKAAKAAAPKRMTIGEARRLSAVEAIRENEVTGNESNSWKTILSRVDGGDWTVARARKEAKDSARYWRDSAATVRRGGGRSNPEKVEEAASRLERAADKYDKLAEDLTISQSVTKTDKFMGRAPAAPDLEEAARTRQGKIDRARGYGNLGTEIEELVSHDASAEALKARVRSRAKREGIPDADIQPLLEAIEGPDRDQVGVEAQRLTDREGVAHIGHAGDTVAFDPAIHQGQGGGKFKKGDLVQVVRPGHRARVGDEDVQLAKATVEEPDRPGGKGPDLVPEGSVAGPRATAPVGNAPRRRELRQAWIAADLPTPPPGSGRKSQEEIKGDVLAGRITPEEGIRRFESEVAFGKEDLAEVDAHLRETDLSPEERGKVERHRANLQATIESHEKQSTFLRDYFKDEAPVVSLKEAKVQDPVSYEFLKDATPDDMREAAKEAGLDPPEGNTTDEMFTDLLKQVARNELARRAVDRPPGGRGRADRAGGRGGRADQLLQGRGQDVP